MKILPRLLFLFLSDHITMIKTKVLLGINWFKEILDIQLFQLHWPSWESGLGFVSLVTVILLQNEHYIGALKQAWIFLKSHSFPILKQDFYQSMSDI